MVLATINKPKQLLFLSFIGDVQVPDVVRGREEVAALLAELESGFRVLANLGSLHSISTDCAPEIGKVMELCDQKGVSMVVRVIPDRTKDIGLGILTHFHYRHPPRTATCADMVEAVKLLSL